MISTMSKVRLVLEVEEEYRDALKLESALSGRTMVEVAEAIIAEHLPAALKQIRERRGEQKPAKGKGRKSDDT